MAYGAVNGFYLELEELRKQGVPEADFGFLENVRVGDFYNLYDFLHGHCDQFAAALSDYYGYPIEYIVGNTDVLIHAYCSTNINGVKVYLDARGITTDPALFFDEFADFCTYDKETNCFYDLKGECQVMHHNNSREMYGDDGREINQDKDLVAFFKEHNSYYNVETFKKEYGIMSNDWNLAAEIFDDIKNQLAGEENCTSYGEPQAFYLLDNHRTIEVVIEQEGLTPDQYYYSVSLNCNGPEFDNGDYNKTNGIIDRYASDSLDEDELCDLISTALACNEQYPVAEHSSVENIHKTQNKENEMSLEKQIKHADAVKEEQTTGVVEMTYEDLRSIFCSVEGSDRKNHVYGHIVFAQESFDQEYSEESRTYVVSSDNKAFQSGMGGYSIFGSSLDGSDVCVRLDMYMRGENHWKVERCYMDRDEYNKAQRVIDSCENASKGHSSIKPDKASDRDER